MNSPHETITIQSEMLPPLEDLSNSEYLERSQQFGAVWEKFVQGDVPSSFMLGDTPVDYSGFFHSVDAVRNEALSGEDPRRAIPTFPGVSMETDSNQSDRDKLNQAATDTWDAACDKGIVPALDPDAGTIENNVLRMIQRRAIGSATAGEKLLQAPGLLNSIYEGGTTADLAERYQSLQRRYREVAAKSDPSAMVLGMMQATNLEALELHMLRMYAISRDMTSSTESLQTSIE